MDNNPTHYVEAKLGVDAGNISVIDCKTHGIEDCSDGRIIDLEPGEYEGMIDIKNSWKGPIKKSFSLKSTGKVYVGDACYAVPDSRYEEFCGKTGYCSKAIESACCCSTGGDGLFSVYVEFKRKKA